MRRCLCGKDLDCEVTVIIPLREQEWPWKEDVDTELCCECASDVWGESLDLEYREVAQ